MRTSGTESMSGFFSSWKKTAGVKSAKLCVEQDQIGKRLSQAMTSFWVDRKDECSPPVAFPVKRQQTESGLQQTFSTGLFIP